MQVYHGSYVGNGSAGRAITGISFSPDLLILRRIGSTDVGTVHAYWTHRDMPAGYAVTFRADTAFQLGYIDSLDEDGFTISDNAMVNYSGDTYYYIAIRDNGAKDFAFGIYKGLGIDDLRISNLGFQPDYYAIHSNSNITGAHTFSGSSSSNKGFMWFAGANRSDIFGSRFDGGFHVSNGSASGGNLVNVNAVDHAWFALKTVEGKLAVQEWTGDGSDNRNIDLTDTALTPVFALCKGDNARAPVARFKQNTGDQSQQFDNSVVWNNCIQSLGVGTFQLGSDSRVNANAVKYSGLFIADNFTSTLPTIIADTADDVMFGGDTTPTLEFTGTDVEGDNLEYRVAIMKPSSVFSSYAFTNVSAYSTLYRTSYWNRGMSFTGNGKIITKLRVQLRRFGNPTGKIFAHIYSSTGTVPSGNPLASVELGTLASEIESGGNGAIYEFDFTPEFLLVSNGYQRFWVIEVEGGDASNYLGLYGDNTSPTYSGNYTYSASGSSWSYATTIDYCFELESADIALIKESRYDTGFANTENGEDTHPFTQNQKVSYTIPDASALTAPHYIWMVCPYDPNSGYGSWSSVRRFGVSGTAFVAEAKATSHTAPTKTVSFASPAAVVPAQAEIFTPPARSVSFSAVAKTLSFAST